MRESKAGMKKEGGGAARLGIGTFSRGPPRRHMAIEEYAVDWNGPSTAPPPRLRLLLLADVDLASAGRIVEWAIRGGKAFDLCAVCGDFVPRPEGWSPDGETEEQLSAEEGEMSSTLAQVENTVCRVIYVPGPLDPVIPSIRLPRARNTAAVPTTASRPAPAAGTAPGADAGREAEGRGGKGDGGKERVLQLTPTSKNVLRRNLRLAPGLSAAGFSEDPNQCPGNTVGAGEGGGAGDDTPEDHTFAALKSLSRSGGKKGAGKAAPVPPESVILLTRLGGPRRPGGGAGGAGANASTADTPPVSNSTNNQGTLNVAESTAGPTALEDQEAATAARLRLLWTEQAMVVGPESEPRSVEEAGGGGGGKLLLHACAGPGTFLAVREALEEGRAEPVGGGGAGGDGDCAGVGCKVRGGTTVAALGSLRQHGAYCVVELDMPTTVPPGPTSDSGGRGGAKEGWSVASVAFGRVQAADGDPEAEREKLARRAIGSFVLNFE